MHGFYHRGIRNSESRGWGLLGMLDKGAISSPGWLSVYVSPFPSRGTMVCSLAHLWGGSLPRVVGRGVIGCRWATTQPPSIHSAPHYFPHNKVANSCHCSLSTAATAPSTANC